MAPASRGGVWYFRADDTGAYVGLAGVDGPGREVPIGPAVEALADSGDGHVLVAEGPSTDSPGFPQNQVEALDATTLQPTARAEVASPADLVVAAGQVWVATTRGRLVALDARTLRVVRTLYVGGSGPARLAAAGQYLWMVNGTVEPPQFLVHRVDLSTAAHTELSLKGSGTFSTMSAASNAVWVARLGDKPGFADLTSVDLNLVPREAGTIPYPVGMTLVGGLLYWTTVEGQLLARSDIPGGDGSTMSWSVGRTSVSLAADADRLWVGSDDLLAFSLPLPTSSPYPSRTP